jgi:hypothetical protein
MIVSHVEDFANFVTKRCSSLKFLSIERKQFVGTASFSEPRDEPTSRQSKRFRYSSRLEEPLTQYPYLPGSSKMSVFAYGYSQLKVLTQTGSDI